jgi:hypothetical protein
MQRSRSAPRIKSYGSVLSHRMVQPCASPLPLQAKLKFLVGDRVSFINSLGERSFGTVVNIRSPYFGISNDEYPYPSFPLLTVSAPELVRLMKQEDVIPIEKISKADEELTKDLRARRRLFKMLEGKKNHKESTREGLEAELASLDDKLAADMATIDVRSVPLSLSPVSLSPEGWVRPRVARGDSTSLPPSKVVSMRDALKKDHSRHSKHRAAGFRYKRAGQSHDLDQQVWEAMPKESSDKDSTSATLGAESESDARY